MVVVSILMQSWGIILRVSMTCCPYPLEMPHSYSEIYRLMVFSYPDMCRCHQHPDFRFCFKSKPYLPRTERAGMKSWSKADKQVVILASDMARTSCVSGRCR